jgi:hypothetical protein
MFLALTFLVLFMGFSAYLYSPRFAVFIDGLLRRVKGARTAGEGL